MVFIPSEFLPEYRPAKKYSIFSSKGWWLNRWPFLGWLETFVKVSAWFFVPYLVNEDAKPVDVQLMSKTFMIETAIMLTASSLLTVAIIDRLVYREIISMIFVFPNNWAHWTITLAMHRYGRHGINIRFFRIFCWLTMTGDIIKLVFFVVHDFSRLNVSRYVLYMLVTIFAFLYCFILLLDYGYLVIDQENNSYVSNDMVNHRQQNCNKNDNYNDSNRIHRLIMSILISLQSFRQSYFPYTPTQQHQQ